MLKTFLKKTVLTNFQKNSYVQQRKVNWKKYTDKHPWEELEKFKEKTKHIPRLEDSTPYVPIFVHDKILEQNIEEMEKMKASGIIPGEGLLKEDPSKKKKKILIFLS